MSQILVSLKTPNTILAVETSDLLLMGYIPQYLVGQNFSCLQGVNTNKHLVGRAIVNASLGHVFFETRVTLYELSGVPRDMLLSFSPCSRIATQEMCCLITLSSPEQNSHNSEYSHKCEWYSCSDTNTYYNNFCDGRSLML